jgi:hypothetical protein
VADRVLLEVLVPTTHVQVLDGLATMGGLDADDPAATAPPAIAGRQQRSEPPARISATHPPPEPHLPGV